ncbi:MAG: ferritin-like domain-containing protein [Wenzhouxiangellaceae bacterium]
MARAALEVALSEPDPVAKCRRVDALWASVSTGPLELDPAGAPPPAGRPARPELVAPSSLPRRGLGSVEGRVALLHAVAHIEFNAINLALDAAARFADMPEQFYRDWLSVAHDEARHFRLLERRLGELGAAYGDLPAHNGLWEMAEKTAHDPLVRMALVPRVLEARGLDVTPGMIEKLRQAGDAGSVACLEVILEEEVRHVAIGSRWFRHLCGQRGLAPEATFRSLLDEYFAGGLRGPFNHPARLQAGFTEAELEDLELAS